MKRTLWLLLAALALIAGCGGDDGSDKAQYVDEFNKTQRTLAATLDGITTGVQGSTSPAQIASKLDQGASALTKAADAFGAITPPDDAKDAHGKIVDGVKDLAGVFITGAKAARDGDTEKLTSALSNLASSDGSRKIAAGEAELKEQGYEVTDGGTAGS